MLERDKEEQVLLKHRKSATKKIDTQYKSTDTYKPSGDFIYDNSSIMNMVDKFKINN